MKKKIKVACISTGRGQFPQLVAPMIDSINRWENHKYVEVVVADAGRHDAEFYPDDPAGSYRRVSAPNSNCSEGQNKAIEETYADWYLVTDVDVVCVAPFYKFFLTADEKVVWGNKFHPEGSYGASRHWIDGWIYAFSRTVIDTLSTDGYFFDPEFQASGFEDADISWRALDAGFELKYAMFPFHHKEVGIKRGLTQGYDDVRWKNIQYLKRKYDISDDEE